MIDTVSYVKSRLNCTCANNKSLFITAKKGIKCFVLPCMEASQLFPGIDILKENRFY